MGKYSDVVLKLKENTAHEINIFLQGKC